MSDSGRPMGECSGTCDKIRGHAGQCNDWSLTAADTAASRAGQAELIADFRREVVDKLSVVFHRSRFMDGQDRRVMKQCEDFLVEQFGSALSAPCGACAEKAVEIAKAVGTIHEFDAIVFRLQARAEAAESALAALRAELEQVKSENSYDSR